MKAHGARFEDHQLFQVALGEAEIGATDVADKFLLEMEKGRNFLLPVSQGRVDAQCAEGKAEGDERTDREEIAEPFPR